MREAIRERLVAAVPEVDGRVLEPHAMTPQDPLPALIVRELDVATDDPNIADFNRVEVFAYTARTSYVTTDALIAKAIAALGDVVFEDTDTDPDRRLYSEHIRTSSDQRVDTPWDGIVRSATFEVTDLAWLAGTTYAPDPVAALRAWTEAMWPTGGPLGDVQTDPGTWNPSDAHPGVYWRYTGAPRTIERWPTWSLVEARLYGHILAPSPAKRLEWSRRVHEALELQRTIHMSDGAPLDLASIAADTTQHMIRRGQITVLAQYGILKAAPADNPIDNVTTTTN